MSTCRTIYGVIIVFSLFCVSHCNSAYVTRVAYKCTGKVVKYGLPVAVIAVIVYITYSHFYSIPSIGRGVKRANRRIDEVKGDTGQLIKDVAKANKTISIVQERVDQVKKDTQQIRISIDLSKKELLDRISQLESELRGSISQAKEQIKIKIQDECGSLSKQISSSELKQERLMKSKFADIVGKLSNMDAKNAQEFISLKAYFEELFAAKEQKDGMLREKLDTIEKGITAMLLLSEIQKK